MLGFANCTAGLKATQSNAEFCACRRKKSKSTCRRSLIYFIWIASNGKQCWLSAWSQYWISKTLLQPNTCSITAVLRTFFHTWAVSQHKLLMFKCIRGAALANKCNMSFSLQTGAIYTHERICSLSGCVEVHMAAWLERHEPHACASCRSQKQASWRLKWWLYY